MSLGLRKKPSIYCLAALFGFAGIMHFLKPDYFLRIMPPYIPYHLELVYLSGFFEIAGAIALVFERSSKIAAIGLIALLVAVFPANINMALNYQQFPSFPPFVLWARLFLQPALIFWVCKSSFKN